MYRNKFTFSFLILLILSLFAVGCSDKSTESTSGKPSTEGGTLKIAISAQPPALDPDMTKASTAIDIGRNIYEGLMTVNEEFQPVPMLAKSVDKSEDGKVYTFHLREGITFHNNKEMTAEDVEASMNRWLKKSEVAKVNLSGASFKAQDKNKVVLNLKERSSNVLDMMAARGEALVMPKEVIAAEGKKGVSEYIGTGPFKFEEWKQDQYIKLTKFSDYKAVDSKPSGLAGKKEALVNDVFYYFVTDPSTRLAGIQTGQYDIADEIPFDNYEQLKNTPDAKTYLSFAGGGSLNIVYNKKEGIFADAKMRQAINAALNMEMIMKASFSNGDLYRMTPSYMNKDNSKWFSEAGKESYNQSNTEKAKQLLKEAAYNGKEIRVLTTRDYPYSYKAAVVIKEQLGKQGINVNLVVNDWATLLTLRQDPKKWDIFIGGMGFSSTPAEILELSPNYAGGIENEKVTNSLKAITLAASQEEAKKHWEELQGYLWNEYLPVSKAGQYSRIIGTTNKLEGLSTFHGPIPWNIKILK
ncbi:ABC transporter substrate-binding protein [Aneurinibacillus sp. REN35]|uniref:ABC transporter substrate-binding protein n=1 Tax=Aneurinibacillus sp. REN35 TaxID=3237286 RepID=UPI003528513F